MDLFEADDCLRRERSVRLGVLIGCLRIDRQRLESETTLTGCLRGDANVAVVTPAEDGDGNELAWA